MEHREARSAVRRAVAGTVHVVPVDDLVPHPLSLACPCGPVAENVERPGSKIVVWMVSHHALDGREIDSRLDT